MSSWEAAREAWELKHMQRMEAAIEDAEKGDPEAMVIMAIGIYHTQYNCENQAIQILKDASDKGSGRASWLLADIYAGKGVLHIASRRIQIVFSVRPEAFLHFLPLAVEPIDPIENGMT